MSLERIEEALHIEQYTAFPVKVFPASILSESAIKLMEILEWVAEQMHKAPVEKQAKAEKKPAPAKQEDDILTQWLSVEDEPDDEFLEKFTTYKLESWGHRVHLRIAWVYLSRFPRRVAMKKIFEGIKNFIDHSDISHKTKFHETMTYFWVHMVHYAMVATSNPTNTFKTFLLMNPQLCNGGFFLEFYTKDRMMSPEAKAAVVLPDKKSLPSLMTAGGGLKTQPLPKALPEEESTTLTSSSSSSSSSSSTSSTTTAKKVYDESVDAQFLEAFEARQLRKWGHESFIKTIYLILKEHGRKLGMNKIFDSMKDLMKSGFHYTKTYFWIHMTDYCVASSAGKTFNSSAEFLTAHKSLLLDETLPFKYFDKKEFESDKAAAEMIPPKKTLPSLLQK
eukprot:TRINITY_DN934_c0_g1_i1.p1 TRINITY_DN934_c0_g1~~TRINITY_DN934_c0_g1_i1.p1  ORF type:complete len:392 (+),score=86.26 TRINITY_DN934_c0_g1_i1:493-1668(+)